MNFSRAILIAALLASRVAFGIDVQCPPQGCPIPDGYGPQPYYAPPQYQQQPQYELPPTNISPSQNILDSVVSIHSTSTTGSGTIIAVQNGHALVISCNHMLDGVRGPLAIGFRSGQKVPASLIETDPNEDLSAFDVKLPQNLTPVAVADAQPSPMEVCTSVGWGPGQLAYCNGRYRGPVLADFGNRMPKMWTAELAGSARPGDSGGAVLNSKSQLCGTIISVDSLTHSTVINATLCDRLKAFIARIKAKWNPGLATIPPKSDGTTPAPAPGAPKPTTPPDSKIGDIAEAAGSWGIGAGLAFLGVGGIPAAVVWWLGRRALHKGIAKLEAKHAERAAATSAVQPAAASPPPIPQPVIYQGPKCQFYPQPVVGPEAPRFGPSLPQPVAVDERYRNLFSYVPDNAGERARAQAVQLYVDRFPGAKVHMENVQKIQDQILKGEPAAA